MAPTKQNVVLKWLQTVSLHILKSAK